MYTYTHTISEATKIEPKKKKNKNRNKTNNPKKLFIIGNKTNDYCRNAIEIKSSLLLDCSLNVERG